MFSLRALTFNKMMTTRALSLSKMSAAKPGILNMIMQRSYHENVIDHYEKPRNVGSLNAKDQSVGTGLVGAPA